MPLTYPIMALLSRFEQLVLDGDLLPDLIPDPDGDLLELGLVVAVLIVVDGAERADNLSGGVEQRKFDFEMVALFVHLEIVLAGLDHSHVVLVGFLAET